MQHKNSEFFLRIENYINSFYKMNGCIPSNKKIANDLSLSAATISRYIKQMKMDGKIIHDGKKTIKIQKMVNTNIEVPVVREIACGFSVLAEENIESYIILSKEMLGGLDCFFLRAKGKSMINAGIDDGDLVLIKKQEYADNGDIAVTILGEEVTLKRIYYEKNGRIRLHTENDTMVDCYVDKCKIQGVAIKVLKDII